MLATKNQSVNELSKPFKLTQQAISKHIGQLQRSGLISKKRVGRESICSANPETVKAVMDWAEQYKQRWKQSFDRLENYLEKTERRKVKK